MSPEYMDWALWLTQHVAEFLLWVLIIWICVEVIISVYKHRKKQSTDNQEDE